ncbi:uncharacterized protein LOC132194749 [Neocloeon triangulifer]|uniref:uncharacterized protein LOC132194749 n=1 Tax=Neocloeon triangulifer TaxID=2078957 RepID=UPI00286F2465|nr:uncharacterized protein LOC132194749 [Neocloeon triangulifer]
MNPEQIVLLLVAAAAAAASSQDCASDGYHWDAACATYWLCKGGDLVLSRSCADGTLFNGLMCVPSALVHCSPHNATAAQRNNLLSPHACLGLNDGIHRDYMQGGCSSYLMCENHKVTQRGECPSSMTFNGLTCVSQSGEDTTCGHNSIEDIPACPSTPGVFSTPSCRGYFYCSSSGTRSQIYECPTGQVFNTTLQMCSPGSSCAPPLPSSCFNKSDGYYQDALSSGCRSYLYCFQGRSITYLCPEGYAYNGTTCLVDTSFECPYWSSDCVNKGDGYHADASSGCRQYFFCLDENRVRTLTCSNGRIFDGNKCTPKGSCPAKGQGAGSECSDKADGRHAVIGSNCTRFVACLGGKRAATGSCAKGFLFADGECRLSDECRDK